MTLILTCQGISKSNSKVQSNSICGFLLVFNSNLCTKCALLEDMRPQNFKTLNWISEGHSRNHRVRCNGSFDSPYATFYQLLIVHHIS